MLLVGLSSELKPNGGNMMRKLSWMLLMPLAWVSLVHSGPWFVETATTTGGIILLLKVVIHQ